MRVLLDTSVLIAAESPGELEGAISDASLAELHFGVLVAGSEDERARRSQRLGIVESTFDPLPIDDAVAREWGRLAAAVVTRGGKPRRRALDLVIAATANVHKVPLLTRNSKDFALIADLVDTREPKTRSAIHFVFVREKVRPEYPEPAPDFSPPVRTAEGVLLAPVAGLVRMKLTSFQLEDRVHLKDMDSVGLITAEVEAQLPPVLQTRLHDVRATE